MRIRPWPCAAMGLVLASLGCGGVDEIGVREEASGNQGNPAVMPPGSHPDGKSYAEWGAVWWQTMLAIPADHNPILDTTGANCGYGETEHVFFLAGGVPATRSCTIPKNKKVFFPLINNESDSPCPVNADFPGQCGTTGAGCFFDGNCAANDHCVFPTDPAPGSTGAVEAAFLSHESQLVIDRTLTLEADLDGVAIDHLSDYRSNSGLFVFTGDASLEAGFDPCIIARPQPAVSDGYWLMLKPLKHGQHKLHYKAHNALFDQENTYLLTVP